METVKGFKDYTGKEAEKLSEIKKTIVTKTTPELEVLHPETYQSTKVENPKKTKEVLGIPDDMEVITLVIVGKHSETISPVLSDKQVEAEKNRPERLALEKFVYIDSFNLGGGG